MTCWLRRINRYNCLPGANIRQQVCYISLKCWYVISDYLVTNFGCKLIMMQSVFPEKQLIPKTSVTFLSWPWNFQINHFFKYGPPGLIMQAASSAAFLLTSSSVYNELKIDLLSSQPKASEAPLHQHILHHSEESRSSFAPWYTVFFTT